MSQNKPPFKGELRVFRVGNHGESLLNVHKAVQAMSPAPKKARPQKLLFEIGFDAQTVITPETLADKFEKVVRQMKGKGIATLVVRDPLVSDFSAIFRLSSASCEDNESFQVYHESLRFCGIKALLKVHDKVAVKYRRFGESVGYLEKESISANDSLDGEIVTEHLIGYDAHNDTIPRNIKSDEITKQDIKTLPKLESTVLKLGSPEESLRAITFAEGVRGQCVGKVWRPDAPIKTDRMISLSELSFKDIVGPCSVVGKKRDGSIKKIYAIVTAPDFQLVGESILRPAGTGPQPA